MLNSLNLLTNLTFYEEVGSQLLTNRHPQTWLYLLEIYANLEHACPAMDLAVEKVLRVVSNVMTDPGLCYDFLTYAPN